MRVKSLVAGVGLTVVTALALGPAVANASRGTSDPVVVEEPAAPAEETPAPAEEPTTTTTTAPEVEEAPPAVEEEPAEPVVVKPPKPTTTTTRPAPVEPVEPPVVVVEPQDAPAPAAKPEKDKDKGACHMDDYKSAQASSFGADSGEAARADKVDRNDNGTVCRKEIPGHGKGNTGEGTNIKDDQVR
jgi:outer membrane biosynthesis protein TonB